MKRQIIKINEELCNGCGLCVSACHEGAIALANGKAKLIRDDYCDGLGDCLPVCPTGAITFEEREAAPYDEEAVERNKKAQACPPSGCPGSRARNLGEGRTNGSAASLFKPVAGVGTNRPGESSGSRPSELRHWPVQLKLVPVNATCFDGADLLVAADCAAYAYAAFHEEFIRNRVVVIGCPKLDEGDYTEKLTAIIANNDIRSLTVVRMEVPCCGGLSRAATEALKASGKFIPWQVVTLSVEGERL